MRVFLSAGIPPVDLASLKQRPDAWEDLYLGFATLPREVEHAICEIVPHILRFNDVSLVFGGQPAITPIITDMARRRRERGQRSAVRIYQSAFFAGREPFTQSQDGDLFEQIQWTPICAPGVAGPVAASSEFDVGEHPLESLSPAAASHAKAKRKLDQLSSTAQALWQKASLDHMRECMIRDCSMAVFVGGMQGVEDELNMFERLNPERRAWLVPRPGGRTERIAKEWTPMPHRMIHPECAYETIGQDIAADLESFTREVVGAGSLTAPALPAIHTEQRTMTSDKKDELVSKMVRQVVGAEALEAPPASSLESLAGEPRARDHAQRALRGVAQGRLLNIDERNVLEAIVLPQHRPVIDIRKGSYGGVPAPWAHLTKKKVRKRLEHVIPAIGRVEVPNHPTAPYAGTGFRVGPNLLMTNRHVAGVFASGVGRRGLHFRTGRKPAVDFVREVEPSVPQLLRVRKVVMVHPHWDMALLQVDGLDDNQPILELSTQHPDDLNGCDVAVIGYPARDYRNDLALQDKIFGGTYEVKRLQPGKLLALREVESFGRLVNAITHDASTLGGNSGSAVVDCATGQVVALHFAGRYLDANFAVPGFELGRDPVVVDSGVSFAGAVEPTTNWATLWMLADEGEGIGASKPSLVSTQASADLQAVSQGHGAAEFTIPITVSIQVGHAGASTAPVGAQAGFAADPPSALPSEVEGKFGGSSDQAVVDAAYRDFSADAVSSSDFHWRTALASACLSHLVYEDEAVVSRTLIGRWEFDGGEFISSDDTECCVAWTQDRVAIAFRGTAQLRDWIANLNNFSCEADYGTLHRGFYHAFQAVKGQIETVLRKYVRSAESVMITGHSLGGALATVAFAEWMKALPISSVYTFGQPALARSDFRAFMKEFDSRRFFRFVNNDDIVTRLAPSYGHVGKRIKFDGRGSVREGLADRSRESLGDDALTLSEFYGLQHALGVRGQPTYGLQEGLLPSFSDHGMARYLGQVFDAGGQSIR